MPRLSRNHASSTWASLVLLGCLVALLPASAGAQTWTDITPTDGGAPLPRRGASAIYDPVDHRMVIFGGRAAPYDANDIWAFDLDQNSWTDLTPSTGPAPGGRFEADFIYDPVEHRVIVYNGQGLFTFYNDVWSFDLTTNQWTELTPPEPRPEFRYGSACVYDPVTRDLVSFAGFTSQGRFQDTWRFSLDSVAWTDVSPDPDPGRRCLHDGAYDSHQHKMLIYAGQRVNALDDLWEFDLTTNQWTELTPAVRPLGRFNPVMVYDDIARRMIIFGGQTSNGRVDEVWAYWPAIGQFERLQIPGAGPSARREAAAIFVPSENRMVIFGGAATGLANDVWSLDLSAPDTATVRAGNVNARVGAITDVLFVNESAGAGSERRVDTTPSAPFSIRLDAPPAEGSGPVHYVLYGWAGNPDTGNARPLPQGIGWIGMPIPLYGGNPPVVWNNIGADPFLGASMLPSPLAPAVVFNRLAGLQTSGNFYLQGIIQDRGALRRRAALTNGVWIVSE